MAKRSRSLHRNKSSKKTIIIWSWILVIIILICSYIGIFHSHRYFGFDIVVPIFMVGFCSLIVLNAIWFDYKKWSRLKTILFLLFVGGPILVLVVYLHSIYIDSQLIGHSVGARGVVTEVYIKENKNKRTPYAVFQYQVNGKIWTQNMINKGYSLEVGDTIELTCSKLDPEIFVTKF